MKIYLASDHAGFKLKQSVENFLKEEGYLTEDVGVESESRASWAEYGAKGAEFVSKDPENSRGIIICGTGLGMSMVSNKFKNVRAALCTNEYMAEMSRKHNNANVLNMGARVLTEDLALRIVKIWMDTPFEGGRHAERLDQLKEVEDNNFK